MATLKEREIVPDELMAHVENLRRFIKDQKMIREENCCQRFTIEPIVQIETEMDENIKAVLPKLEIEIQRCTKTVDSLKKEARELLHDAEMSYRLSKSGVAFRSIYNSPENLHFNSPFVDKYFQTRIEKFEERVKVYQEQIKDLQTLIQTFNKSYTPEELFAIIRRQHEILVGLSSQVYAIQDTVAKSGRPAMIA
ncbi:nucleoporin p58/p45 [Tetranychus urticae]|nr:nucleoporin p58/p45 [Tetranychus urticae]